MPRNKIDDLRNHLFETIEMLKDKEIDVNTAKAISEVAQVIVNTAKVEIQFINRQNSSEEIGFIKLENKK
jgi:hypothetical protein